MTNSINLYSEESSLMRCDTLLLGKYFPWSEESQRLHLHDLAVQKQKDLVYYVGHVDKGKVVSWNARDRHARYFKHI